MKLNIRLHEIIYIDNSDNVVKTTIQHKGRLNFKQASELIGGYEVKSVDTVNKEYAIPIETLNEYAI